MKKLKEKKHNLFNRFCLRTPLLPFSFYANLTKKSEVSEEDFSRLLSDPILREAIYLASPELETQLQKWQQGLITDQKKKERLQFSLLKYASRITTRCTPFGLFASCAGGEFGETTTIEFDAEKSHTRSTRFDMSFLAQLQMELLKNQKIRKHLLFYPNTSLYAVGGHFRYIEYTFKNKRREYSLEGFSFSEYISKILQEAEGGKKINELGKSILEEDITTEEANDFVEELIKNQVLVSELELTVTGDDYFQNLLKVLEKIPETEEVLQWLYRLNDQLLKVDTKVGNSISTYKDLIELSKEKVDDFNAKYLLQTDSFLNLKTNTLSKEVIPQLLESISVFTKMGVAFPNAKTDKFKTDFRKRYDDALIPLNIVLDSEVGIGYGEKRYDNSQFLDDVPTGFSGERYQQFAWTGFDDIMQEKLFHAYQSKDETITLKDSDLDRFSDDWDSPDTFATMIEVVPQSEGEKIFIANLGGSSGANLLGRFTGGDEKLYNHVQEILDFEDRANPDKLVAEIVHLPESRVGNILQRSNNRSCEITYLGKSSLESSQQIPIDDILVSVSQNRVVLQSKKLKKEIIPKLSNAHNFKGNPLPIYEFLCDLQNQEKRSSVGFSWNPILLKQPYLPRVEYKNLILSKARWLVKVSDFEKLMKSEDILKAVEEWRIEMNMPELIDFVERDNKLLINLKNKSSVLMLYNSVKKRGGFILEEFLFKDFTKTDKDNDLYCNQYVVSFYKNLNE